MRLLLDTHAFLWSFSQPKKLPKIARDAIEDQSNEVFVSAVSFWEISIKVSIGKLEPVGKHPAEAVEVARSLGFNPIPLLPEVAASYGNLTENTHFDPFDRMLIWQAISQRLTVVSGDSDFSKFKKDGLKLLWK
ncbi:MAG: type II toxin-antitoxin system VapC family toxin [Pyrinomonadaceae bacterium]